MSFTTRMCRKRHDVTYEITNTHFECGQQEQRHKNAILMLISAFNSIIKIVLSRMVIFRFFGAQVKVFRWATKNQLFIIFLR